MYSLHRFLFKIFPLHRNRLHGSRLELPRHGPSSASRPASRPVPALVANSRHRAPETQKGGKISPAARRGVRCYRTGKP